MNKLSLTLLTVATLVFTVSATTLFEDPYTVSGGGDANFEYTIRQSGAAAPVPYGMANGPFTVTNAGPNAGKLNILAGIGVVSHLNIASHNFTESGDFSVEVEIDRIDGVDNTHSAQICIGTDGAWLWPEGGNPGLTVRIYQQGHLKVYLNNGTALINDNFNDLKVSVNQKIKVRIVVSQVDFAGSGDGQIALFINDKAYPLQSLGTNMYILTNPGGFANNYINLQFGEGNVNLDNLKVMTSSGSAITTALFTGDADSGVNSAKVYTHSVNLADPADVVINGQTFTGAGANQNGSNWEIRTANAVPLLGPLPIHEIYGIYPNVTPASRDILTNVWYSDQNGAGSLTLTGLTPAQQYILTLYSMAFDVEGGRRSYMATSDGAVITDVDQDEFGQLSGQLMTYQYTANAEGVFSISTTPITEPWAFYAFSNEEVIPEPAFIGFIILGAAALLKRKF